LTVPTEQPSASATWASVISSQNRNTTTDRCPTGKLISAAISVTRSIPLYDHDLVSITQPSSPA
jgi:hypothetical protein